ncbi:MAG: hypothetical protein Rhims3KO_14280 [Hyphomicrobiales bacterium]
MAMRPGQSNKRSRGRGGRKGPSPLSRSYESNGPDVKIRGTAQHIADKYINLARDAQSSGDPVLSEAYFQHAEHFYRIVAAAQQQMNQPVNVKRADDPIETEEGDEENENFDPSDPDSPQPQMNGNGSGNGRDNDRRSFDDDGERRPRRNRGRSRRGRDDERSDGRQEGRSEGRSENRSDNRSGNGEARAEGSRDASSESAPQSGDDQPRSAEADAPAQTPDVKPLEATQAENVSSEAAAPEVAAPEAGEEKPARARRAPRARKASVEVADRSEGGDAPAAPKPVSLGDDVAPVQAVPDES